MNHELTIEVNSFEENELIIEKGLNTFYEVGSALAEIRDARQYKETHSTFEDYCVERWLMTRQSANRLIASTKVINNLEPIGSIIPATESQTRELSKAPAELALKLKPILAEKAKESQIRKPLDSVSANSPEQIDTREELAKQAGVSHDTIY